MLIRYFAAALLTSLDVVTSVIRHMERFEMALLEHEYMGGTEGNFSKRDDQRWLEILRRWVVQCPNCSETRLVVGAQENSRYVCKDCGYAFVIKRSRRHERTTL